MNRWVAAVAIGCLIATAAVVGTTALGDDRAGPGSAETLARELRCPDCQGLSVADSPTQPAREIRRQIDSLLADGATPDEVRAHFVARYGEWILLAPRSPILWILPWAAVLLATAILVAWLARRRTDRPAGPTPDVSPPTVHERRRVREEAEALDA